MRTVAFFAFDGLQALDLIGPIEVLRAANGLGAEPPYHPVVVSPNGESIRSESDVTLGADLSSAELARRVDAGEPLDTVVVVGGRGARALTRDVTVLGDLAGVARRARRVTSVCTGAFVLAAAGLLDGHQATTHWAFCDRLAERHPAVDVLPDRIYVQDRNRWTSAGVTAGIDLFLALVEADHGPERAHAVAGWLVVFVRRPGGQAQFSAQLAAQPARTPALDELQRWLPDHLTEDLTVEAMARRAAMSPRTFARAFRAETGRTPAGYVEELRVEAARRLLETSDLTVDAIAPAVGYRRAETLYRAFSRRVGTTPDQYRRHFAKPQPTGA